jgi:hypothetical protein
MSIKQTGSNVYVRGITLRLANTILTENKARELTQLNFKTAYKATAIKTVWCQEKNRQTNRTEQRAQR